MLGSKIVICLDDLVKIGFHELKYNINIPKLSSRGRKHYMFELDNIRMAKQTKQLDLSQYTGRIRNMLEYIVYFLDCNPLSRARVDRRPNHAITSLSNHLLDLVLARLAVLCEELLVKRTLTKN